MIKTTLALLTAGMLTAAATANAQSSYDNTEGWRLKPEFSIGAGYGLTKLKDGDFDEDESAAKVFALMKFNEFIGIEASYIDFDEAGNDALTLDADGKALAVVFEVPVHPMFALYAKGGNMWWDADASVNAFDLSDDYDGDETFWGVGAKFRLAEHLDLKVEYERFNFDISRDEINVAQPDDIDMDVDYASVNLQYTF